MVKYSLAGVYCANMDGYLQSRTIITAYSIAEIKAGNAAPSMRSTETRSDVVWSWNLKLRQRGSPSPGRHQGPLYLYCVNPSVTKIDSYCLYASVLVLTAPDNPYYIEVFSKVIDFANLNNFSFYPLWFIHKIKSIQM